MSAVYICSAKRSAIGSFGGSLAGLSPRDLGIPVARAARETSGNSSVAVDEVIIGNVLGAGHGMNIARQIALGIDLPVETPAFTINKVCGSGLKAVVLAAQSIRLGDNQVVLAGGVESMSQAGFVNHTARFGNKMGELSFKDLLLSDGLTDAFSCTHMGCTAENLAREYSITREAQDAFAVQSQSKAAEASTKGWFQEEIAPISIPQKKGEALSFLVDEFIRPNTDSESLSRLRPVFEKDGTVTAGNASGINDGAAFLLLASEQAIKDFALTPLARVIEYASGAVRPEMMGIGPVEAVKRVLQRGNLTLDSIELVESNEAFAAQALAVNHLLGWESSRVNVVGGAIALGHPIGASGARILVTLIHQMRRLSKQRGLATLCVGGGQGVAVAVELVDS